MEYGLRIHQVADAIDEYPTVPQIISAWVEAAGAAGAMMPPAIGERLRTLAEDDAKQVFGEDHCRPSPMTTDAVVAAVLAAAREVYQDGDSGPSPRGLEVKIEPAKGAPWVTLIWRTDRHTLTLAIHPDEDRDHGLTQAWWGARIERHDPEAGNYRLGQFIAPWRGRGGAEELLAAWASRDDDDAAFEEEQRVEAAGEQYLKEVAEQNEMIRESDDARLEDERRRDFERDYNT